MLLVLTGNHRVTIDEIAEEIDPSSSTVARATSIPVVRCDPIAYSVYIYTHCVINYVLCNYIPELFTTYPGLSPAPFFAIIVRSKLNVSLVKLKV